MKASNYSRRLRNAHQHEGTQKESFFSQSSGRKQHPFFNSPQGITSQVVQTQLTVGKADDSYEREADQVASNVVAQNGQSPDTQQQGLDTIQRVTLMSPAEDEKLGTAEARMEKDKLIQEKIQRMDSEEELQTKEEDELQAKEEEELQAKEEDELQAKDEEEIQAKGESSGVASSSVNRGINKSAGKGRPLSGGTRVEMERAFGADFSAVNIHTDINAVRLNKELHSQAFTRGQDIFFNEGKYRPETSAGKHLLAHELTHVVQQCGSKVAREPKKPR